MLWPLFVCVTNKEDKQKLKEMEKPEIKDVIIEDKKTGLLITYQPKPEKVQPKLGKFQKRLNKAMEEAKKWSWDDIDM